MSTPTILTTRRQALKSAAATMLAAGIGRVAGAAPPTTIPVQYRPRAGHFWDHWLWRGPDGVYHLYYLYEPPGVPPARHRQAWSVGQAISRDLVHWQEQPVALAPREGSWLDLKIATGSTIDLDGRYAMLITGSGRKAMGFGVAFSNDLVQWRLHEEGPVLPPAGPWYETPETWKNNPPECAGWADPYVFRKPGEKTVYAIFNARVTKGPMFGRGSIALARSEDMVHWTLVPPLYVPGYCTRCETPQIFTRNGRWYVLASMWPKLLTPQFKAKHPQAEQSAAAMVWTAPRFEGPYELAGDWALFRGLGCYICKIIEAPDNGDVVLTIRMEHLDGKQAFGLAPAYHVTYPHEGGIRVHLDQPLSG